MTLSHHNNSITVDSGSGDIIILNATTGGQSGVLSGHIGEITCVTFSFDGTSLVSGSSDKTVKLWDVQTGGVVKTFFGHTDRVSSVSISSDCTTVASGSGDRSICLWNIQAEECYHTIQQQTSVSHVVFSPTDSQHLIFISDEKVWQWSANGCQIRSQFNGSHAAFSSDGAWLVSCFEKTIMVHNSSSGASVIEFQVDDDIHRCCFSPDNGLVAVAAGKTVYCWDVTTSEPKLVETFNGHTDEITSLIFSSSTTLISASKDKSVKFWQIGAQSTDPAIISLKPTSLSSAPIKSVILQSNKAIAITTDSNGVMSTWDILTGTCKTSSQTPAGHYNRCDAQLVNDRLIFVWNRHKKIYAWDGKSGKLLWEMDIPWKYIDDLKISGDGSWVFGMYTPWIWAWSLQTGEVMEKIHIGYGGTSGFLIVDGSKVWAELQNEVCTESQGEVWNHWTKSHYKGWDFGIPGSAPVELSYASTLPGPSRFWDPKPARIKNPATGEVVFQLSRRFANLVSEQCNDSYLVAGYESGEVLILDLTNVK